MGAEGAHLGEVIAGYRLERLLGTGAMSSVYLGTHVRLNRKAAIKVLSDELAFDPHTVRRLLDEARVVNDIHHPQIIDISDFVETDSPRRVALVMEYVRGPSLRAVIEARALSFAQAIAVIAQLCDAVQAAHRAGVIHRDLKPENVLFAEEPGESTPRLKVVDFGIAKSVGPGAGSSTATGTMIGTPAYMAPEQIAGSPPPSPATDVYAIGELLYEVLVRARAFPQAEQREMVRAKMRGELPALELAGVPHAAALGALIGKCLAFEAEARPSVEELAAALRAMEKSPAPVVEPRRSVAWVFALVAGVAGAIAAVSALNSSERAKPQPVAEKTPAVELAPAFVPERVTTSSSASPPVVEVKSKTLRATPAAKNKRPAGPNQPIGQDEFPSW